MPATISRGQDGCKGKPIGSGAPGGRFVVFCIFLFGFAVGICSLWVKEADEFQYLARLPDIVDELLASMLSAFGLHEAQWRDFRDRFDEIALNQSGELLVLLAIVCGWLPTANRKSDAKLPSPALQMRPVPALPLTKSSRSDFGGGILFERLLIQENWCFSTFLFLSHAPCFRLAWAEFSTNAASNSTENTLEGGFL
jgi:hypothetical protein